MKNELISDVAANLQIVNESIDEAIEDNVDFITMDITDAIEVSNTFRKVMVAYGENGIN